MTGRGQAARVGVVVLLLALLAVLVVVGARGPDRGSVGPAALPGVTGAPTATSPAPEPSAAATAPPATPTPAPAVTPEPAPGPTGTAPAGEADAAVEELAAVVADIEAGVEHLEPVEAGEIAHSDGGFAVVLEAAERVNAQATGPGEVSGPALALRLTITNTGAGALTLDDAVVNLYGDAGAPGSQFAADPRSDPFTGVLEPGGRATATYVVSIPPAHEGQLMVSLFVGPEGPTPLFITTVSEES